MRSGLVVLVALVALTSVAPACAPAPIRDGGADSASLREVLESDAVESDAVESDAVESDAVGPGLDAALDAAVVEFDAGDVPETSTPDGPGPAPEAGTDTSRDTSRDAPLPPLDAMVLEAGRTDTGPAVDAPLPDVGRVDVPTAPDGATGTGSFSLTAPLDGSEFIETVVAEANPGAGVSRVQFVVDAETTPRCDVMAAPFRCVLHLTSAAAGASVTVHARGVSDGSVPDQTARVTVRRRGLADLCAGMTPRTCVASLATAGRNAGYAGLTYENRDGNHTMLNPADWPGLTYVRNNEGRANLATNPLHANHDAIVVMNASQSLFVMMDTLGLSLPRVWLDWERGAPNAAVLARLWRENKFHWGVELWDHGLEDFYAANAPFHAVSQGSSGTEMDEVASWLVMLGAYPSAVRTRAASTETLMPATTMIFRRARVDSDAEYLTELAHPSAFANRDRLASAVRYVESVRADEIPPVALLRVESETFTDTERHFTTEPAIARLLTMPATRRIVVNLGASFDANGRRLTYHWRLHRGDAARVRVRWLDAAATRAELEFDQPQEITVQAGRYMRRTSRATVAFFAHNGLWWSPPAFVNVYGKAHAGAPPTNNTPDE